MFDVSFGELLLIGIVALLVIGPERLPKVARTAGLWAGRARQFIATVKDDIEKELKAEELKRMLEEQAKSSGIHEIIEETKGNLEGVKGDLEEVKGGLEEVKGNLESVTKQEQLVNSTPPSAPPSSVEPQQQQSSSSGAEHDHKP